MVTTTSASPDACLTTDDAHTQDAANCEWNPLHTAMLGYNRHLQQAAPSVGPACGGIRSRRRVLASHGGVPFLKPLEPVARAPEPYAETVSCLHDVSCAVRQQKLLQD